jgi:hypothetical protein
VPFRIGVPEILLLFMVCGLPLFTILVVGGIVWLIVRATGKSPKPPMVGSTITPAVDTTVTAKLTELNGLLESNLITQEEYNAKKAEIIKQM